MGKRFAFSVAEAIPAAWKLCWNDNLKKRAEGHDFRGNTYYLTSADIEYQVRQFADETSKGEKWGKHGRTYGRPMTMVRMGGDLQAACRRWLQNEVLYGRLVTHNFKKGHISGARFRPVGAPLSEAEEETFKKINRPAKLRPLHLRTSGGPKCTEANRGRFSRGSKSWTTSNPAEITCPRCKKLLVGA